MAIVNKKIGLTDTVLLSVPAGSRFAVTTILVCNTASADTGGSNDSSFDLHLVPNGQAKGNADPNSNQILNDLVVAGADTFTFDTEKIVLEGGDRIIAVSQSPANLNATVSYLEV
jgi:hypothetical protein|tara:strand:+ start:1541 stop:1885 length:345 start_codon:yes stop_codon:yes gene_type:complete